MNRKSKIIVSVVGITIVLLALLGITYAYYLTRIEGNTNTNSISVTTADLKLIYGDGTGPNAGLIIANDIMPGTDITKEFTVTNKGKSKVEGYLVVLENVHNTITRKQDVVYTLDCKLQDGTSCGSVTETIYPTNTLSVIYTNDIDINVTHNYTLTVHYKNLEDVDQSEDMGKSFSGRVNIMDGNTNPYKTGTSADNTSLVYNIINNAMTNANGTIYRTVPITNVGTENSEIYEIINYENRTLQKNVCYIYGEEYNITYDGKFVIEDAKTFEYSNDLSILGNKYIYSLEGYDCFDVGFIIDDLEASGVENIYFISDIPSNDTIKFGVLEKTGNETSLSIYQDNLGTSYYFRGAVQDNYVLFNNMCFRIVRIEGDGSVKLIFAGDVTEGATNCNEVGTKTGLLKDGDNYDLYTVYGYDEYYKPDYKNNVGGKVNGNMGLEDAIENWYTLKFTSNTLKEKLKVDKWCLGGNDNYIYDEITGELIQLGLSYSWNFAAGNRFFVTKIPSLMCEYEDFVTSKYGTITSDEIVLAGASNIYSEYYYLNENASEYWTLSMSSAIDNYVYNVFLDDGKLKETEMDGVFGPSGKVRPAITLIPEITISGGDGTKLNPYIIN